MWSYDSEQDFREDLFGKGAGDPDVAPVKYWIGGKPKVNKVFDHPPGRRDGYPFNEEADYDPRLDEDWSDMEDEDGR